MDLPVKWHYHETKIRQGIKFSRKSPGYVLNVTFGDLLPEFQIKPMRLGRNPWNADEISVVLSAKWLISNDKFDMNY